MKLIDWFRNASRHENVIDISDAVASEENAEASGLDFRAAVAVHQNWKARLIACVDGTSHESLDPRVVCRDDQCALGKWINGSGGQNLGSHPLFSQLKVEHAQFHIVASEILLATYGGRSSEASKMLDGSFAKTSNRVQSLLANLFLEITEAGRIQ